ncbi:Cyanate hydratase [Candidatus Profftia lariciata]|uniref:cyanase n=1 Tax=Candidatus Profftia lariciata TaxID=1987921 RepID=UPI001D013BAB|nr:cyanase [Candidatus Profftia lariciata]UDG81422.1 Cyanate hydratase [Candidatus Profftia lariciata]
MAQVLATQASRIALTEDIIAAKIAKNLSWQDLAENTNMHIVFVTAALLGQHPLPEYVAQKIIKQLALSATAVKLLQATPMRGAISNHFPVDPTIYRFYEILQVYGTTLKALINEQFGDGIISAINFKIDIKKVQDPEGGFRAIIIFDGKYLPINPF